MVPLTGTPCSPDLLRVLVLLLVLLAVALLLLPLPRNHCSMFLPLSAALRLDAIELA